METDIDSKLPLQSRVHKFIPKSKFFEKAGINSKLKKEFADKIQKIWWEYKLAPDTIGIQGTKTVEEVQIFEIVLKERVIPKNILKVIDKSIPYPILYVFSFEAHTAFGISLKGTGEARYYFSDWDTDIKFNFTGLTLETVYQGLVTAFISGEGDDSREFATIVETDKKQQVLEKEIQVLQNKIKNEKQFNKKVVLNTQLQTKQKEHTSLTKTL
ncbi:hypothetical protein COB80_00310 [Candidatus Kaiserbacteria bacterium]|nr:MAG: hypothetical protein COB80_00310 [Candidatus Kaiserbacteria bacterium]